MTSYSALHICILETLLYLTYIFPENEKLIVESLALVCDKVLKLEKLVENINNKLNKIKGNFNISSDDDDMQAPNLPLQCEEELTEIEERVSHDKTFKMILVNNPNANHIV